MSQTRDVLKSPVPMGQDNDGDIVAMTADKTGEFKKLAARTDVPIRTAIKTIGLAVGGVASGRDHDFECSEVGATEEVITLTNIFPANCRILDIALFCTTALLETATPREMAFDIGSSSGGNQYLAAANCGGAAGTEAIELAAAGANIGVISAAAASIYVSGTPAANWNVLTAGAWFIAITYADYNELILAND